MNGNVRHIFHWKKKLWIGIFALGNPTGAQKDCIVRFLVGMFCRPNEKWRRIGERNQRILCYSHASQGLGIIFVLIIHSHVHIIIYARHVRMGKNINVMIIARNCSLSLSSRLPSIKFSISLCILLLLLLRLLLIEGKKVEQIKIPFRGRKIRMVKWIISFYRSF